MRLLFLVPIVAAASACAAQQQPLAPIADPDGEVRLRCGSENLRARIRAGVAEVERSDGTTAVLPPSTAGDGAAYGDGQLTFYKIRGSGGWQLAEREGEPMSCRKEAAASP